MKKIKLLIGIIILTAVFIVLGFIFSKKEEPKYSLMKVSRGQIIQEVSETGTVKMGQELNLSFKSPGRIEEIYVKTGDEVKLGQSLAKLDTVQLSIQLREAEAALAVAQSQLNKLLAGATAEEIKITQTAVLNSQTSLENAEQHLEDVKKLAESSLSDTYGDALNVLEDAYLKALNSFETVRSIQLTYFTKNDQEGIRVRENKDKIETVVNQIKSYSEGAEADPKNENIDLALSKTKESLNSALGSLVVIRQTCEEPLYRDVVSSTDKTSLDTHKTNTNTVSTSVTNSQQAISSTKTTNVSNINTAKSQVLTAEGSLRAAQDELSKLLAPARQEDVDLYQAKIKQSEAQINLLQTQIRESVITSPSEGKITDIKKRAGETAQTGETIISFLSTNPFQVEVDIYEGDIVKLKVGNPVEIKLAAIAEKTFGGKVVSIDPAEKIIEGVVYYKITIDFAEAPAEIKPGMTADVVIKTASKDDVIIIPQAAIEEKNGDKIVRILKNKNLEDFEERKIEIGIKGNDDLVEVLSGLQEGEEVVVR